MDDPHAAPPPSGLYVVATPIGNLEDITLRAIRMLSSVDLIAAEDTRHTARLLAHFDIRTPLISCHEHNEQRRTPELLDRIRSGGAVAVVSDAGTPAVSDPGYRLVRAAVEQGLPVFPVPGVSAVTAALSAAGLPTDAFVFIGFTPQKRGRRLELLHALSSEPRTLVFYEAPRRIIDRMAEIRESMGDRPAVLAREVTKLHEEFLRGSLSRLEAILKRRPEIKGECTLLVGGAPESPLLSEDRLEALLREALSRPGCRVSSLSKTIARQYRLPRKRVYTKALALRHAQERERRDP